MAAIDDGVLLRTLSALEVRETSAGIAACKAHVEHAIASRNAPLKLFRTVDELCSMTRTVSTRAPTYDEINAVYPEVGEMSRSNCHNGQRKLALALLEFIALAISTLRIDESKVTVLYPGASGVAAAAAAEVFQHARFVLYDPAPNTLDLMPPASRSKFLILRKRTATVPYGRLILFTEGGGLFDDREAAKYAGIENLLFVSDIRMYRTENRIAKDMCDQQRWVVATKAAGYMLKFRMPYAWNKEVEERYSEAASGPGVQRVPAAEASPDCIPYLDGKLFLQLYPKQASAELRLIGFPRRSKYVVRPYHTKEIEDALALFNAVYRGHATFSAYRSTGGYERVVEHRIAFQLLSHLKLTKSRYNVEQMMAFVASVAC